MITKEDIQKEFRKYRKLCSLEPLFGQLILIYEDGPDDVCSYEEMARKYNSLIDAIGHFLEEMHLISKEEDEYIEAFEELLDKLYG